MNNLLTANHTKTVNKRYSMKNIDRLLKAQIENSLECGWPKDKIILIANFDYSNDNIKTFKMDLNASCLTGSKIFSVREYFMKISDEDIWSHDLDCWQNWPMDEPEFKDVGVATYSTSKYNGGSIFWKKRGLDIINAICDKIEIANESKEEPTLNKILKDSKYKDRVTLIDNTYNVGCSGFVKRYNRSEKPIRVNHFHPYNLIAFDTHVQDRNGLGEIAVSVRLERLLRKWFKIRGKVKAKEKKL
jgi:hypothetical protein